MAREIKKEIQRIEGQLLVAKQICQENVVICSFLFLMIYCYFSITISLNK